MLKVGEDQGTGAGLEIIIPDKLPLSKKRGSELLLRLQKRANWLRKRIGENEGLNNLSFDRAELVSLDWAIAIIIEYETELATIRNSTPK